MIDVSTLKALTALDDLASNLRRENVILRNISIGNVNFTDTNWHITFVRLGPLTFYGEAFIISDAPTIAEAVSLALTKLEERKKLNPVEYSIQQPVSQSIAAPALKNNYIYTSPTRKRKVTADDI